MWRVAFVRDRERRPDVAAMAADDRLVIMAIVVARLALPLLIPRILLFIVAGCRI